MDLTKYENISAVFAYTPIISHHMLGMKEKYMEVPEGARENV